MSVAWNSGFKDKPNGSRGADLLDDYIRETRSAVEERLDREHEMLNSTASKDGAHSRGSSRCYVAESAPTPGTMEAELADDGDASFAIGRQWLDSAKGQLYIYDGTSWVPIGYTYGQIAYFTEATHLPSSGFVLCNSSGEGTYTAGTKTVHVPDLIDKFIRGGAGYSGSFTEGGADTDDVTLVEANIPEHDHDMDHGHPVTGEDDEGIDDITGIRFTKRDTTYTRPSSGAPYVIGPCEVNDVDTAKTETGTWGQETVTDVEVNIIPTYVGLLPYCFVGSLVKV